MTTLFSAEKLFTSPSLPQCRVSIIIPARDEAENLDKTLRAATRQVDLQNRPLDPRRFEIIVLANNCRDETAAVARRWAGRENLPPVHVAEIHLPREEAHVGRARRILMDEAFRRLRVHHDGGGVIASTDGDTQVAPDWVAANLYEINLGADAVGGHISIAEEEWAKLDGRTRRYYADDFTYRSLIAELEDLLDRVPHDAFPRHHQHFGASFAVTTKIYERSGGLPPVSPLEDVAFYDRLQSLDARFRHSPLARVKTSARHDGRVSIGLAWQLNKWTQMGKRDKFPLVASADEMTNWFLVRRKLRGFWENLHLKNLAIEKETTVFAGKIKVKPKSLHRKIRASKTFGVLAHALWIEIKENTDWSARFPLSEVRQATRDLRLTLEILRKDVNHQKTIPDTAFQAGA